MVLALVKGNLGDGLPTLHLVLAIGHRGEFLQRVKTSRD
jgi:hypothetical protein